MNRRTAYLTGLAAIMGSLALAFSPLSHWSGSASPPPVAANATTRPVKVAKTADTEPSDGFTLPEEFAILQTRNAFARGAGRRRGSGPEAMFVFKGAVRAGATFTALIEDLAAKRVLREMVGDKVARGRITSIDLDGVMYAASGKSRRIAVGQDLEGIDVPPTPPPAPASQPSPEGSGNPPGPPAAPRQRGPQQGTPPRQRGPAEG